MNALYLSIRLRRLNQSLLKHSEIDWIAHVGDSSMDGRLRIIFNYSSTLGPAVVNEASFQHCALDVSTHSVIVTGKSIPCAGYVLNYVLNDDCEEVELAQVHASKAIEENPVTDRSRPCMCLPPGIEVRLRIAK